MVLLASSAVSAQHGASFASAVLSGEAEPDQTAGGGVIGAGQGVVEDAGCGGVVAAPGDLVGEVAQEAAPRSWSLAA
ncbi:hypothetical protein ACSCB1_00625 [Streptomyces europaeiscabiei]|uniref:hypothetical protein n=1 Tax=Streptomyces europaeiscabiei TaxID=146819 RepID=UPI0006283188|nr:hypothetical protein [Streptomyces europaeiscabiei]